MSTSYLFMFLGASIAFIASAVASVKNIKLNVVIGANQLSRFVRQ